MSLHDAANSGSTPIANALPAIEVFTDGACSGNPGPGGWGAIIRCGLQETEISGGEQWTTNNRMELLAAIRALEALPGPSSVILHTDSQYVRKGITSWITAWKRNGWRTAANKPVLNRDLWERLDAASAGHQVDWRWVRGHSGHAENKRADVLARVGAFGTSTCPR